MTTKSANFSEAVAQSLAVFGPQAEELLQRTPAHIPELPTVLDGELLRGISRHGLVGYCWEFVRLALATKLLANVSRYLATPSSYSVHERPSLEQTAQELASSLCSFDQPPFTVQRICELLLDPTRSYTKLHKYLYALAHVITVVSVEPTVTSSEIDARVQELEERMPTPLPEADDDEDGSAMGDDITEADAGDVADMNDVDDANLLLDFRTDAPAESKSDAEGEREQQEQELRELFDFASDEQRDVIENSQHDTPTTTTSTTATITQDPPARTPTPTLEVKASPIPLVSDYEDQDEDEDEDEDEGKGNTHNIEEGEVVRQDVSVVKEGDQQSAAESTVSGVSEDGSTGTSVSVSEGVSVSVSESESESVGGGVNGSGMDTTGDE